MTKKVKTLKTLKVNSNNELIVYQNQIANIIDLRLATAKHTVNLLKARKCMIEVASTLMSADYRIEALNDNVHTINTKDHDIAIALSTGSSLNHYTRAILLTAKMLHENGLTLTNIDTKCACDGAFKAKSDHDKLIVLTSAKNGGSTNEAQVSSSRNALQNFGILKALSRNTYALQVTNKNYLKLIEAY